MVWCDSDIILSTRCSEYYKEIRSSQRPDLAWNAKFPHMLPQGGVEGETEYDHRYIPLRPGEGRVLPRWFTWSKEDQRSPFGLTAARTRQPQPVTSSLR